MAEEFTLHTVSNEGKAPRGIFTRDGMVTLNPGDTRELHLSKQIAEEEDAIEGIVLEKGKAVAAKAADPLDHDGDGKKGGSKPPAN